MKTAVFLLMMIAGALVGVHVRAHAEDASGELPDIDSLWDYQDPGITETRFRELLGSARASQDTSYYAQLVTQIARTQGLQHRFDEAHATLDTIDLVISDRFPAVPSLLYQISYFF